MVVLDSLYGLPLTSRMGRGKQPKQPKELPRLLPVGEHPPLPPWVVRVVREEQARLSHRSMSSVQLDDLTNL